MATPGLKQDIFKIYKKYGIEYAREFWKASVDAIDLLENIIQEEKLIVIGLAMDILPSLVSSRTMTTFLNMPIGFKKSLVIKRHWFQKKKFIQK